MFIGTYPMPNHALRLFASLVLMGAAMVATGPARASSPARDGSFVTSDGVRLHYLEAGSGDRAIVFIPGWLMPAAVFDLQLAALSGEFRVLALDPRSQGQSDLTSNSHDPKRRTQDILEFLAATGTHDFILAGWSLGVMEVLDLLARTPLPGLRGLILIDNSIGEGRPPAPRKSDFAAIMKDDARREAYMRQFSKELTKKPPPANVSQAILDSVLRAPGDVAIELLNQPYPREYWRQTVEKQSVPVMYAVTPRLRDQADALRKKRPGGQSTVIVFANAGHALFLDDPKTFNAAVEKFARAAFDSRRRH